MSNPFRKTDRKSKTEKIILFRPLSPKRSALMIALAYLVFGVIWILTTDNLLEFFFGTTHTYALLQTFKGWIYVAFTALFIYTLVKMTLLLYQQAKDKIQESKDELEKQYDKILESEQRFDLAVKGSFDSIWEYDGKADRFFMSTSILKGLGYAEEEIKLSVLADYMAYVAPIDQQRLFDQIQSFTENPTEQFEITYRLVRKDASLAWIRTRGSAQITEDRKILKVAGSHTDISVLIEHQEELTRIAYYEPLTGLPNWEGFGRYVTQKIQEEPQLPFTLFYLDLDDFQNINDFHGYQFGDKLLIRIAAAFTANMKPAEKLASLGGDSFGFLIATIDKTQVLNRIADLYAVLDAIRVVDGVPVDVKACIGIAQYSRRDDDYEALMHSADEAMHAAKHKGKNTFVFFTSEIHQQQLQQIALTNKLRKAVEKNELTMVYQPIYRLSDGKMASIEALVRWFPKDQAAISPDLFIPLAETSGLIGNIELWVFEAVFKQVIAWRPIRSGNIPVAINMSSKGISDEDFVKAIIVLMDQYGILPGEVEIEITETSLIEHTDKVLNNLHLLHQEGIKILLDDFGKGYSSLTYLVSLPIDTIKIDKGFTQKIHSSAEIDAIIKTIVDLAHLIRLKVIAEGIEAENQQTFLKAIGVDFGQGYLLHMPTAPAQLESELK